ncbi:hypothetical protein T11_596 [Trichinella zimbabwensis]|uniref:Uncharacterized protein n=1 Tax=Trichinella zimbabwensis TaxID=268475 RepID=A0A0V1HX76_9BILA|nr:hypothetical protein T11_596 [Trichinella zimbabwensis]
MGCGFIGCCTKVRWRSGHNCSRWENVLLVEFCLRVVSRCEHWHRRLENIASIIHDGGFVKLKLLYSVLFYTGKNDFQLTYSLLLLVLSNLKIRLQAENPATTNGERHHLYYSSVLFCRRRRRRHCGKTSSKYRIELMKVA